VFLTRLNGQPIGYTVIGIFVIDKNAILTVWTTEKIIRRVLLVLTPGICGNACGGVASFRESATPQSQGAHHIQIFWGPYVRPNGLT